MFVYVEICQVTTLKFMLLKKFTANDQNEKFVNYQLKIKTCSFLFLQGNRLLCIRSDKICLIDMKTRIIYKEQRIADLEHWITSGHHLSAGIN
jgi:hypothetical protein